MPDPVRAVSRRRGRIALLVLLGLGLLAAVLAFAFRDALNERVRVSLESGLSRAVHGEVRIATLSLSPLRLRALATGVSVRLERPGVEPLIAHVDRLVVAGSLRTLLRLGSGGMHLRELEVDAPVVSCNRALLEALVKSERAESPIDFRIDRLIVIRGKVSYDDQTIPVSFAADQVGLRAAWDRARKVLAGEVRAEVAVTHRALRAPLSVTVRSGFRLGRSRLDLSSGTAEANGITATAGGHLLFGDGAMTLDLEGTVHADLQRVAQMLMDGTTAFTGIVDGPVRLAAGSGQWKATGTLQGTSVRVGPFEASRATADAEYHDGRLVLTELRAASLGGSVEGEVAIDLRAANHPFGVDLTARNLDLNALVATLGRSLPVSGHADGEVHLQGSPRDPEGWTGSGFLTTEGGSGPLACDSQVTFTIDDARVAANFDRLRWSAAEAKGTLEWQLGAPRPTGVVRVEGTTAAAGETRDGLRRLAVSLGLAPPAWMSEEIGGSGTFRATLNFGDDPLLDGELQLQNGRLAGESFEEAAGSVRVAGAVVERAGLTLRRGSTRIEGSGRFRLDPLAVDELKLEARAVDLGRVASRFAPEVDVRGAGDLSLVARRGAGGLEGSGRVTAYQVVLAGEGIDRLEGDLQITNDGIVVRGLRASGAAGTATGELTWADSAQRAELRIGRADLSLARIAALGNRGTKIDGAAELDGVLRLERRELTGELNLRGTGWNVAGVAVGDVAGTINFHGGKVAANLTPAGEGGWRLEAELDRADEAMPFQAALTAIDVTSQFDMGPAAPKGLVTWSGSAEMQGSLRDFSSATGDGTVTAATVRLGNAYLDLADPVTIRLEGGVLHGGPVRAQGRYSDVASDFRVDLASGALNASARGRIDLAIIASVWPDLRASGSAELDLQLSGSIQQPVWGGTLVVHDGRLRHAIFGESLEKVELSLTVAEGMAKIDHASAVVGGGELQGKGQMSLSGFRPGPFDAEVQVSEVRLQYPVGFRAVYSGTLYAQGELDRFLVSGRLDILRGAYTREFSEGLGSSPKAPPAVRPTNGAEIYLDVDLAAESGVWLQNESARVEASVDLHLGGEMARPELTGRIHALEGGTVHLRDAEYRLVAASLDFTDLDKINPFVDVQAETRVQDYEISLRVQGTMEKFDYKLTSNPSLATQDILSLLTTGQTLQEGQSTNRTNSAQTDLVASYVAGSLTANLERGLKTKLRLDRVRIDPFVVQGEADPTARVTIGKRVSKDLLLIYSADLGNTETQIYRAEWGATRKLKLSAQRNTEGGVGGDLSYSVRLGERRSEQRAQAAAVPVGDGARSVAAARIAGIRIEGVPPAEGSSLLAKCGLLPGFPLKRSATFEAEQKIRSDLVRETYLEARVDSRVVPSSGADGDVDVVFTVTTGPAVAVEIVGLPKKERRLVERRLKALWLESASIGELYEDAENAILEDLRDRGYYTAQVARSVAVAAGGEAKSVEFAVELGDVVKIDHIRIEGNEAIPSERILQTLASENGGDAPGKPLRPQGLDHDRFVIQSLYLNAGFLNAQVGQPSVSLDVRGTRGDLVFQVSEGARFTLSAVTAKDPPGVAEGSAVEWAGLVPGQPFSYAAMRDAESRIRIRLDSLGYPECRVTGFATPADGVVAVEFKIDPGERKVVGEVALEGNLRTKDKVIQRELPFRTGDPLSREQFIEAQQRLYRLGIFRNVRLDYQPEETGSASQRVRVRVEELPPLRLGIGAGYDTEEGIRGSFSISHDNLGGSDRTVSLQTFASEIYWRSQLLFQDPRLFNWKMPSIFNLSREHREQEGFTEDTWATALRLEKRLSDRMGQFIRYNFQQVNLSDVASELAVEEEKLENVRLGDVGYTWAYDGRNDPFVVREGSLTSVETRLFSPLFLSEESFVKVFTQASLTHTFDNGTGVASLARFGIEIPYGGTSIVPISERFFAGGDSTVRGFPRDGLGPKTSNGVPAGGEAVLILNQEFRFPIYRSIRGVTFFDAGNVWSEAGDIDLGDLRPAVGAGLRLDTPIGPVRFEYGRKLDRQPDESRGEFFISIGLAF